MRFFLLLLFGFFLKKGHDKSGLCSWDIILPVRLPDAFYGVRLEESKNQVDLY